MNKYNHAEAFCHMLYRSETSKTEIWIWNSRDGVTPFCLPIDGEMFQHVNFGKDKQNPDYKPKPGDYIFRTVTREDLVESLTKKIEWMKQQVKINPHDWVEKNVLARPEAWMEDEIKEQIERGEPTLDRILPKPITIAIDFDGTCVTHEFPAVGGEIGAAPVLKKLVEAGHRLVLFTMRSNCEGNTGASEEFQEVINGAFLDDAVSWFKKHDIPLFGIQTNPEQISWTTSPKAYAQLYIDDAALGCPLNYPPKGRPHVDWFNVELMLRRQGIIE